MKRERIVELRKSELGREGIKNQYYFREANTIMPNGRTSLSTTKLSCQIVKDKKSTVAQSELCLLRIGPVGRI